LKSLQNDQVIIAGKEVELNDLKNATHFAMASQVEGEEPKPAIDHLIAAPEKLQDLLNTTSLATSTEVLVWVKSY
jgi:hypothetical protein